MGDEFISEFTKSKAYKIQINILYNTKDTDDSNSDDLNTNYFIINNMRDILIEEFKNEEKYAEFKKKYEKKYEKKSVPLYIVKDSYYIDRNVMESLRKVTTSGFPQYKDITSEQYLFGNYVTELHPDYKSKYQNKLVEFFKNVYENTFKKTDIVTPPPYTSKTLEELAKNENFLKQVGSRSFKLVAESIYKKLSDPDTKKAVNLFYNITTNKLSNKYKYEYFLDPNTIIDIFKVIDDSTSSGSDDYYMQNQRKPILNDNRIKEELYTKYYKYLFPNKKDIYSLTDSDKDKIIMFYNVYYIIKNIYLLDDTIISVTNYKINKQPNKKYYIKQVGLRELDDKNNVTHFQIKDNEVIIFIKATLEYIIENPILQINYLIDDLENARQNFLPQSYILEPKDISNNYSNYNKIYIHDNINYKNISSDIDYFAKVLRKKNTIKNKEEFFLNTQALKLFNNYFQAKFKQEKNDNSEANSKANIDANIKFLLYVIFKFYNNKVFKKYYIADTYIKYFKQDEATKETKETKEAKEDKETKEAKEDKETKEAKEDKIDADDMKYYSIINKSNKIEKNTKYKIISTIFNESPQQEQTIMYTKNFYQKFQSSDARLQNNNIYKINVVFRCFLDKNGMKPTLGRKLIAENCLSKAQKLDAVFTKTLYKTFRLPENYLYNKLANITHKQKQKQKPNVMLEENVVNKGGSKITNIYKYNKNSTRKYKSNATIILTNNN